MARVLLTRLEREILEELVEGDFRILKVQGSLIKGSAENLVRLGFITKADFYYKGIFIPYYLVTASGLDARKNLVLTDTGGGMVDIEASNQEKGNEDSL